MELRENHGRAKIRNLLAGNASNKFLLFIDADSKIPNKSYIRKYLAELKHGEVIYGGRSYQKNKPGAKKVLHWLYGSNRESLPAKKRNKAPYLNFLSNNFLIPSDVFAKHRFDPAHEGYGYEDTLFATRLMQASLTVRHIDNPLLHSGLENSDIFLKKTLNALDNLILMFREGNILETRLIRAYHLLEKYRLTNVVYRYLEKRIKQYETNLLSASPSLRSFDLWKLYFFIKKLKEFEKKAI